MTRRGERFLGRALWAVAGLLALSALGAGAAAIVWPEAPRPLGLPTSAPKTETEDDGGERERAIETLAKKRLSKKIVKKVVPPPPPPPKPPAPPLVKLIRLTGILDFGSGPPEALIEIRQARETRNFKVGDELSPVPAKVESIGESVVLGYDGKRWNLTYAGVSELRESAAQGRKK